VLPTVTAGADGTWSVTLSGGNVLSADTVFTVRQQVGGVWSPMSAQYKVFFDNTAASSAPTLVLDAASDTLAQDGITASQSLKFTGAAEAKAYVEVWDNGLKLTTVQADALGAWETTLTSVSEGAHTYTARQYDAAGNFSIFSTSKAVTVDIRASNLSAPVLDSASDSGTLGDLITTALRPKLTGAGAEAGATVSVYDGASLLGTATAKGDGFMANNPPEIVWTGFQTDPYVLEPGSESEAVLAAAHASVHGGSLPERRTTAVNDTRYYGLYFDIPGLCYGPKGEGAHAFDERTSIEDLRKCTRTMATFIADWCGIRPRG
jgi:hypothetical protein